ncbi:MAG: tRNA pseudouridine(55) synthase TruB [Bacteroidales bacterium]|nr:tRNA pseudouridine(55) synthase TruB [Bacteroidales bacterium]
MMSYINKLLFLIDKPIGWTSFDVVKKIRNTIYKHHGIQTKVGHAGTLDPLATGLLIIGIGKGTKLLSKISNLDKTYRVTFDISAVTPSFDRETNIIKTFDYNHIDETTIHNTIKSFIGEQYQTPPVFSAKIVNGVRAYKYAQKGVHVELKKIKINIRNIFIEEINLPHVRMKVECSKGTYIRSLVNDIGKKLTGGAYVVELKRIAIGNFTIENSYEFKHFLNLISDINFVKNFIENKNK